MEIKKIGLGGGCHWCTEAVFLSLKDVIQVEQGFISSKEESIFSEAVIVSYNSSKISLKELIEIHLYTHKSTSNHSMRGKYRSAVYAFNSADFEKSNKILDELNVVFDEKLITRVSHFERFKPSEEQFHNYYYTDSNKPFCTTYITPKLSLLLKKYGKFTDIKKVEASISHEEIPK
ncbi:peptide-methionine (S)-S-oxide reductase [Flagellimonas sp.]|uniref:peptide-methionine (S)-S-oxide reductase n=1 Tax=Flagellimonas sp. TaxID=2058762 RepID=UPI003F49C9E8